MAHTPSPRPIADVAAGLDLAPSQVVPYGFDKAKITLDALDSGRPTGRLVLVSAITVRTWCDTTGVPFAVSDVFALGGEGGSALAEAVMAHAEHRAKPFTALYDWREAIPAKMEKIARAMYGAREVSWTKEAQRALGQIEKLGFGALPLCVAKTQKSLSDDPQVVGRPEDFEITVRDLVLAAGAGYVVPLLGDIMRMPGLPAAPQAEQMDLVDGRVVHAPAGPASTTDAPA